MLQKLFKSPWFPITTRIAALLAFVIVLLSLIFGNVRLGPFDFTGNLGMLVLWSLWWPFLYITILFLARGWCGFLCPIGLANEVGNRIHKGTPISLVKWGVVPYLIFFLVVFWEQISGVFVSVQATLLFIGAFFAVAFVMGVLVPRLMFCRLICPIGTLLGTFSRLSIIGLRTNPEICARCLTKDCIKGNKVPPCPMYNPVPMMNSNKNCLLCMNCIKNCPYESAKIGFVKPDKEFRQESLFTKSESLFIIGLLGLVFLFTHNGSKLLRIPLDLFDISVSGPLTLIILRGYDFIISLATFTLIYLAMVWISSKALKLKFNYGVKRFGYAYLPLVFAIFFFTLVFGFISPWFDFSLPDYFIAWPKYLLLIIGSIWSISLTISFARMGTVSLQQSVFGALPHLLFLMAIVGVWAFYVIPGPLNIWV